MTFSLKAIFQRDERYDGVRRINIYILQLLYILIFFVLGKDTWTHILTHPGPWDPTDAVAWCVRTAVATLAGIGIIRPVKCYRSCCWRYSTKCCGLFLWRILYGHDR